MSTTQPVRLLIPWNDPSSHPRLASWLRHQSVAAIGLRRAALADAMACRALAASIHSATGREEHRTYDLPALVVVDPNDLPGDLAPPVPGHLALDLAAGGEDFEVTLKVLTWARSVAEMGVDLVLSPRLDRTGSPLDDGALAARLTPAWTEGLLAAGLVACAGPWTTTNDPDDDLGDDLSDEAWAPFGAAAAHGLEAVFVERPFWSHDDLRADVSALRDQADELVVIGPPASDLGQVRAASESGVDLIPLAEDLVPEEIEAILEALRTEGASRVVSRIDRLRADWLV